MPDLFLFGIDLLSVLSLIVKDRKKQFARLCITFAFVPDLLYIEADTEPVARCHDIIISIY